MLERGAKLGRRLLVVAAVVVALAGIVLALGQPRLHTLMVYAAVTLAAAGVALGVPAALRADPDAPDEEQP